MTQAILGMAQTPQNGASGGQPQGNFLMTFAPLIIIFVIFYFLLIRPQKKQQKKMQEMLSALRKGDNVVTRGGIHGKITGIADNVLTVEIANNVNIKVSREAIINVTPGA
ncbi:MAG: preprotein translocase subunit YajC [Deltaproteobacteria bacterium]|nr:preprotein translocase subunit YajC [Deltaproteobacteria bacterium]